MTAACVGVQLISKTQGETGGFAGVLRRFWVVPNPEIGFSLRPLTVNPQIGNELAKSILFEQSRVELVRVEIWQRRTDGF
jgi:hypothetical protein